MPTYRWLASAISRPPASGSRSAPPSRRRLTLWSALVLALATVLTTPAVAHASTPVVIGSVDGGISKMEQGTGRQMADHAYAHFDQQVPVAAMITVRPSVPWRQVVSAQPGSATYNDIVRWAQTIKGRGTQVMLAYHHEPEATGSRAYGSASDFIAAYRRVETIFKQQGANNVTWVWQMTAYAFRVKSSDSRYAPKWYPGDAYVSVVGGDGYNWGNACGRSGGTWTELQTFTDPIIAFARAHQKMAALPEFGAPPDPRRAQWLTNAHQYFANNQDIFVAAFYFDKGDSNCNWVLNKQTEFDAFSSMLDDRAHFRTSYS